MKRALLFALWIALGNHSSAQLREIPLPFADTTCFRLQFVDENHGWVTGLRGTIFHTTNAGVSWNTYTSPFPTREIREIRFSSRDYGILWAFPATEQNRGKLYQTFNAGRTWEPVTLPFDSVSMYQPPKEIPTGIVFMRYDVYPLATRCILFHGRRMWTNNPREGYSYEDVICWTSNGGQQWETNAYQPPKTPSLETIVPMDTNRWGRFRGAFNTSYTPESTFEYSEDRGRTWTGHWSRKPLVAGFCEFWDSKHGIIIGSSWIPGPPTILIDSGSYVTSDGGVTWKQLQAISSAFTVARISDSVYYMVLRTGIDENRFHGKLVVVYHPWTKAKIIWDKTVTAIQSIGGKLYVLLIDGRLLVLDDAVLAAESPPHAPDASTFTASPNPAHDNVTLTRIDGSMLVPLVFELYDMAGRRVLTSADLQIPAGQSVRTFSVATLPSGVYRIVPLSHPAAAQTIAIVR